MKLHGLVVAAHTPFTADGELNLAVVEKQAEHYVKQGLEIAFIGGSTGESHSLSLDERLQLARRWFEVVRGLPLKVVVHVGSNCLADARTLAGQAEQLGALAIAALAPSYFKPRHLETLIACCAEIAAGAPATPFYFYDIPGLTGVSLSMPDFLAQRRPHPHPRRHQVHKLRSHVLSALPPRRERPLRRALRHGRVASRRAGAGAQGAVGSSFNFGGPIYRRLLQAFRAGDLAAARRSSSAPCN